MARKGLACYVGSDTRLVVVELVALTPIEHLHISKRIRERSDHKGQLVSRGLLGAYLPERS